MRRRCLSKNRLDTKMLTIFRFFMIKTLWALAALATFDVLIMNNFKNMLLVLLLLVTTNLHMVMVFSWQETVIINLLDHLNIPYIGWFIINYYCHPQFKNNVILRFIQSWTCVLKIKTFFEEKERSVLKKASPSEKQLLQYKFE